MYQMKTSSSLKVCNQFESKLGLQQESQVTRIKNLQQNQIRI